MLQEIIKNNIGLAIANHKLTSGSSKRDLELIETVTEYINAYLKYYNLPDSYIVNSYDRTLSIYLEHLKLFKKTGKYPCEAGIAVPMERVDYDISLLLSILVTEHRFQIMKELYNMELNLGKTLVIGVGTGVEIELISHISCDLVAYDSRLCDFVIKRFSNCDIREKEYSYDGVKYDTIVAIELLEHLENPFSIIDECSKALKAQGNVIVTTATNIPQFDHKYNFASDTDFERNVSERGFEVWYKQQIVHKANSVGIESKNIFYVLRS